MRLLLSFFLAACSPAPTAGVPVVELGAPIPTRADALVQDAFVWQRVWQPALGAAVQDIGNDMRRLLVLAAEVEWTAEGTLDPTVVDARWSLLAEQGRPVGVAVRSAVYTGEDWAGAGARVAEVVAARVAAARAAGVQVGEIHLDVDCPTARLADYIGWLDAVKAAVPGVPLSITTLPDWQNSPDFPRLLAHVESYVLQVHWLAPANDWDDRALLDPVDARAWVKDAARFGVPFRVALPTYGYGLGFDEAGRLVSVAAETREAHGAKVLEVRADPRAIAELVAEWSKERPAAMEGIAWFRLPTALDRRGWAAVTLRAVMKGTQPAAALRVRMVPDRTVTGSATFDVVVDNVGSDTTGPGGVMVVVCPRGAPVRDMDTTEGVTDWEGRFSSDAPIAPGSSRTLGWIRMDAGEVADGVVLGGYDHDAVEHACDGVRPVPAGLSAPG